MRVNWSADGEQKQGGCRAAELQSDSAHSCGATARPLMESARAEPLQETFGRVLPLAPGVGNIDFLGSSGRAKVNQACKMHAYAAVTLASRKLIH